MDVVSERLSYHKFTHTDVADYMLWYTNDEVMKHITGRGLTQSEAEARFRIALGINEQHNDAGFYAVRKRGTDKFVGIAKFVYTDPYEAEVGYGMLPEFWGKGYGSEILDCMVKQARKHHRITKLIAIVSPDNHGSKKILTKKGFVFFKEVKDGDLVSEYFKLPIHQEHP